MSVDVSGLYETYRKVLTEIKATLKISWPIVLTSVVNMFNITSGAMFVGYLGKDAIDAVNLAIMVVLVFGAGFQYGMASSCDTLMSQAYGSVNKLYVGVVMQRGIVITIFSCLIVSAICINTEHMLYYTGQDVNISRMAGRYAKGFLLAFPAFSLSDLLKKIVYVQGHGIALVAVWLGSLAINLTLNYVLVTFLHMGPDGANIAMIVSIWAQLAALIVLVLRWKLYTGLWHGMSFECLEDWGEYFAMAVPGVMMLLVKWMAATVTLLVSGNLGTVELAAYSICHNISKYFAMIASGLTLGSTVRLGMHVGSGNQNDAKFTAYVYVFLAFISGILFCIVILAVKDVFPYLFTNDREVVQLAERLSYLLALYTLFSVAEMVLDANIRGTGNQFKGAVTIMSAYCLVALPIALPLMLNTEVGVYGGFIGLAVGVAYQCAVYLIITYRMDWGKEVELAQKRARVFLLPKEAVNEIDMEISVSASGKAAYGSFKTDTNNLNGSAPSGKAANGTFKTGTSQQNGAAPSVKAANGSFKMETRQQNGSAHSCNEPLKRSGFIDDYESIECCTCKGTLNIPTLVKRLILFLSAVLLVCVSVWLDGYLTDLRWIHIQIGNSTEILNSTTTLTTTL